MCSATARLTFFYLDQRQIAFVKQRLGADTITHRVLLNERASREERFYFSLTNLYILCTHRGGAEEGHSARIPPSSGRARGLIQYLLVLAVQADMIRR